MSKSKPSKTQPAAPVEPAQPDDATLPLFAAALAEKIKELVRLAKEQGQLTFDDVGELLTEQFTEPAHLDHVYSKLREMEIEVVDAAEVDRVKSVVKDDEDEDDHRHLDSLDDPVRMYLKQMGAVPLLTREQEVEISKRIEAAEADVRRIVYRFGFASKEHIAIAEKLLAEPPRERFDRVVLDGALVRGLFGGGTYATGFVLRLFQVGNLQGYAFLFGAGVVALIYFMIFK